MSTTTTDPIADMLTRIRNAINVRKNEVRLRATGFLESVTVTDLAVGKQLHIVINAEDANARITEIKRLSKPGRRVYSNAREMPTVKRGRGVVIVSTSKGLMTGKEAKQQGLGGELIASIY